MLQRLRSDQRYREMFEQAFGGETDPFTIDNVVRAIASFERTLIAGDSAYGRLVFGDRCAGRRDSKGSQGIIFQPGAICRRNG